MQGKSRTGRFVLGATNGNGGGGGGGGVTFAAPALTLGTSNIAGSSGDVLSTDATVLAFDATAPTTLALGNTPTVGTAPVAARRDHGHGIFSSITGAGLTWPLTFSGDMAFQPDGVANSVLTLTNDASAVGKLTVEGYAGSTGVALWASGTQQIQLGAASGSRITQNSVSGVTSMLMAQSGGSFTVQGATGNVFFTALDNAANSRNGLTITGSGTSVGDVPIVSSTGPDTNIGMTFTSKGNGTVLLNSGNSSGYGTITLRTDSAAGTPSLSLSGGPSASLVLSPNGTGALTFTINASGSAAATILNQGDLGLQANNVANNTLLLHNNGSAVNGFQVTGTATGSGPILASIGSDTNIDLNLNTKGTGVIRFGYASVVQSGVTPALLGNTGGGPGTAAQYGWRAFKNSDDTVEYIPVWR